MHASARTGVPVGSWVLVLVAVLAVPLWACTTRDLAPITPCTTSGVQLEVQQATTDQVDLLFLIDDSGSMEVEQRRLADQIERLVTLLTTGDRDGDGEQDFTPVADLQVAIVSSDMGTGGVPADTCNDAADFGDDGIARTTSGMGDATCAASYPAIQRFDARNPTSTPMEFAHNVSCVARRGTRGCAFEQQLEAVLKAATPSSSAIRFHAGSVGQGDGANAGFVRADSILAVVVLSDEDDCSATDPELFRNSTGGPYGAYPLNQRCAFYPDALHPIARYVDGLRALRADRPERLLFAAIVGVPPDLVADPAHVDYDGLLADSRMQQRPRASTSELEPVCQDPAGGAQASAYPARRIVSVARALGEAGVVQSICQSDYRPALDALVLKIASVIDAVCLPRALVPNAEGRVACDVVEYLPASGDTTRCAQLVTIGRDATAIRIEDGREVCRVAQAPRGGGGLGWYYDDFSDVTTRRCGAGGRRVAFTTGAEPVRGALVKLECLQTSSAPESTSTVPVGGPCGTACPTGLFCDDTSRTCQRACTADPDCGALTCDTSLPSPYCVSPTC